MVVLVVVVGWLVASPLLPHIPPPLNLSHHHKKKQKALSADRVEFHISPASRWEAEGQIGLPLDVHPCVRPHLIYPVSPDWDTGCGPNLYHWYCMQSSITEQVFEVRGQKMMSCVSKWYFMLFDNIWRLGEWMLTKLTAEIVHTKFNTWLSFTGWGSKVRVTRWHSLGRYKILCIGQEW